MKFMVGLFLSLFGIFALAAGGSLILCLVLVAFATLIAFD